MKPNINTNLKILIPSLIYSIGIIFIDKQDYFEDKKYEPLKLFNYFIWFSLSLFTYITDQFKEIILGFCSSTIVINFIYETIYHYSDLAHCIHHILTIITIMVAYLTNSVKHNFILKIINIFYVAFLSSIFSSIRKLTKNTKFSSLTYHVYKFSYIVSKYWGFVAHYNTYFFDVPYYDEYTKFLFRLCILIHLNQMYFIGLITRSYYSLL